MEIFTPEFCQLMLQEVNHFESWCAKQTISILRPNSMNNYGVPPLTKLATRCSLSGQR
jgi:hypothetical protein